MAMIEATVDTFADLSGAGDVLVDIWGPQCQPCLALMPAVEALEATLRRPGAVPESQRARQPRGLPGSSRRRLPAYLTMRDGVEVERLTSNGTTPEQIEQAIIRLLDGAPAVGPPVPEHLRTEGGESPMELHGKKVIALGERDSVPGEAIAAVARSAGAEVIEIRTECFV